jgi:acyl carrier protein
MIAIDDVIRHLSSLTGIPAGEFTAQTALYGSAAVSSLMMLELMAALEKEYCIYIKPEELIEENFTDVGSLRNFIERKQMENGPITQL